MIGREQLGLPQISPCHVASTSGPSRLIESSRSTNISLLRCPLIGRLSLMLLFCMGELASGGSRREHSVTIVAMCLSNSPSSSSTSAPRRKIRHSRVRIMHLTCPIHLRGKVSFRPQDTLRTFPLFHPYLDQGLRSSLILPTPSKWRSIRKTLFSS